MDQAAVICRTALPVLLASLLPAQEVAWERAGIQGVFRFDYGLASLGDVDGDGESDILVRGDSVAGSVLLLLSAADGSVLRVCPPPADRRAYPSLPAAAGDWNQDGRRDYVITHWDENGFDPTVVEVRSGWNDQPLLHLERREREFGTTLLSDLDLNGDARPDLAIWDRNNDRIECISNDGRTLYTVGSTATYGIGFSPVGLARVGDLDGDGGDDFALSVRYLPLTSGVSGALIVSGKTGSVLHELRETRFLADIFNHVVGPGDLDGDAVPDLALGSTSFGGRHVIATYSGRDWRPIWERIPTGTFTLFGMIRGAADFDRDGVPDLLTGAYNDPNVSGRPGAVYGLSGRDGSTLFRVGETGPFQSGLGVSHDVVLPTPDDPFPRFVTSEQEYCPYPSSTKGRVRLFRAVPEGVELFGTACAGGLPSAPLIGFRDLARAGASQRVRVQLAQGPPGVCTCLVLGVSDRSWNGVPLPLDLGGFGLPGCALYTSIEAFAPRTTGLSGNDAGYAHVDVPLPLQPPMHGVPVFAQWLVFGPGNTWPGGVTQALRWPR